MTWYIDETTADIASRICFFIIGTSTPFLIASYFISEVCKAIDSYGRIRDISEWVCIISTFTFCSSWIVLFSGFFIYFALHP